MRTRQAKKPSHILIAFALLSGLWACAPADVPTPSPSPLPTPSPSPTSTPTPKPTPTATPLECLSQPGRVEEGELVPNPPLYFRIYLPPCYDEFPGRRYPVLYLLHGQTYTYDQWIRLGAVTHADRLILSGEAPPFLIVFPDDRYWNLPAGEAFGRRLVNDLIPYIDATYRTVPERAMRAIGGLSRGGGWAIHLVLEDWQLFGVLGAHSPAIFYEDRPFLEERVQAIPPQEWPRLFIDIGDNDSERGYVSLFEDMLASRGIPHIWRLYAGDHSEAYWGAHVEEYLRWYASAWEGEGTLPDEGGEKGEK